MIVMIMDTLIIVMIIFMKIILITQIILMLKRSLVTLMTTVN